MGRSCECCFPSNLDGCQVPANDSNWQIYSWNFYTTDLRRVRRVLPTFRKEYFDYNIKTINNGDGIFIKSSIINDFYAKYISRIPFRTLNNPDDPCRALFGTFPEISKIKYITFNEQLSSTNLPSRSDTLYYGFPSIYSNYSLKNAGFRVGDSITFEKFWKLSPGFYSIEINDFAIAYLGFAEVCQNYDIEFCNNKYFVINASAEDTYGYIEHYICESANLIKKNSIRIAEDYYNSIGPMNSNSVKTWTLSINVIKESVLYFQGFPNFRYTVQNNNDGYTVYGYKNKSTISSVNLLGNRNKSYQRNNISFLYPSIGILYGVYKCGSSIDFLHDDDYIDKLQPAYN